MVKNIRVVGKMKPPSPYRTYWLTEVRGKNFQPGFEPALSPSEMLKMGVFEGKYLNSARHEYPSAWFKGAKLSDTPDPSLNFFGVKSRTPLSVWQSNGWVHPQDPRGWFEWYCRYYNGRRSEDDARQIKRWRAFVRHSAQVLKNGQGDINKRRVQRQALLQWAWDPFPDVGFSSREESVLGKCIRLKKEVL